MCFGKARIFHNARELSDFDDVQTRVTFIQESVPDKAIRYLWKICARTKMYISLYDCCDIHSAVDALRNMDLLPHHVDYITNLANDFGVGTNYQFPEHILSHMGTVIGQACVGLRLIPKDFDVFIKTLSRQLEVPCWMVKAFAEIYEQQPSILEPYALLIVKGVFRFIRKHFGRRRKYLSKIQLLGLDKLLILEKEIQQRQGTQGPAYIGIEEHVRNLRWFLDHGCHCTSCKSRAAMLGTLLTGMTARRTGL